MPATDETPAWAEGEQRWYQDAVFHARACSILQTLGAASSITRQELCEILVVDEKLRAQIASSRPDHTKELRAVAQLAGYLDLDGEPTEKLRRALYGDHVQGVRHGPAGGT